MGPLSQVLLELADGSPRAVHDIATVLSIDAGVVNERIRRLLRLGVPVALSGDRVHLRVPIRLLDAGALAARVRERHPAAAERLEVVEEIGSTNDHLLGWPDSSGVDRRLCFAECQLAGRGRRGRTWRDAAFRNLKFSVGWLRGGGPDLPCVTLAAGVAVAAALEGAGLPSAELKWPNDILYKGRKLAGLLCDSVPEADGRMRCVIGVGVNLCAPDGDVVGPQPATDLASAGLAAIDRERLAADLAIAVLDMLQRYENDGFDSFRDDFERRHRYNGRSVVVRGANAPLSGVVVGINSAGALLLREAHGAVREVCSGEVSVRLPDAGAADATGAAN